MADKNNDSLGFLSSDDLQAFNKNLKELKELPGMQEQLVNKILKGEQAIIDKRNTGLEEYFDKYYAELDKLADKQSKLYNSFNALDKKLTESPKANNNSGNNGASPKKDGETKQSSQYPSQESQRLSRTTELNNSTVKELTEVIHELAVSMRSGNSTGTSSYLAAASSGDSSGRGYGSSSSSSGGSVPVDGVSTTVGEETRSALLVDEITELRNKLLDEQRAAKNKKGRTALATERVKKVGDADELKSLQELEKQRIAFREKLELEARLRNNGKLSKADAAEIERQVNKKYKLDDAALQKLTMSRLKADEKAQKAEEARRKAASRTQIAHAMDFNSLSREDNLLKRFKDLDETLKDNFEGEDLAKAQMAAAITALSSLAQQLEKSVDEIASHKGVIDTRLQGSKNDTHMGSYWDQLVKDMTSVGAVTPFFKQENFAKNIESLVNRGIAFDLKQRAFLMTIQEKIANTFDAADGTLLRLIRLQQEDSTAGRLGMESALNTFLNEMYENTEYLQGVAKSVRDHLQEMEALMTGAAATEVEYQVQKWMGSLYSVGMSDAAVNTISTALGQIAAGQIEGLVNGGAGNLLVMAANNAGIPIADILATGLTANDTNKLLQATVNYLAEIAESSKGNNVVQQQLANVFGVKASDLRAATNLATPDTLSSISGNNLTYQNLLGQLFKMAGSMWQRTSMGEMMSNVWANGQYTLAGSMASNPVSYITYKAATLLDNMAGGIAIPGISVMGNMVDLETTVADLMRVAAMSGGILGSIGSIVSGLGNSFDGRSMLNKLGIDSSGRLEINQRGTGEISAPIGGGQRTLSSSGHVGNAKASDIKDSTMQAADDEKKKQMIKAKEAESSNQIDMINMSVLKIYEILDEVTKGSKALRVKVDNYGLTGENARVAQGGTSSLLSSNESSDSLGEKPSSSGSKSVSSSGTVGGSMIDLGGWTMM